MRRAIVTSAATVSGVVLLLSLKPHDQSASAAAPITSGGGTGTSEGGAQNGTGSSRATAAPTQGGSTSGKATGGTRSITGDAAGTRYGPVQVRITVTGRKITDVSVVQYPSEDRRDQEINSYALPVLNQEALTAQSARIDAVSGATYTSDGYTRSLQSAIDRAGL
ncbi:FMN-binding protein [Streptacidiphilus griseoplanus]|uniref:FMN-binding protein n=1 Tax=Peterkaempfera griseoplana TaxID=66896 RepID=UPI0006E12CD6|nr:FMN-binding protein [Peterkaempfera griseoplana]